MWMSWCCFGVVLLVLLLSDLAPKMLKEKDGCAIWLKATSVGFAGSTRGDGCKSSLRGASHTTSEVKIAVGQLASWDRGYDANGKQVWGAVKGPYVFRKLSD